MEDGSHLRADTIIKNGLNTDLREIGAKWLPEDLQRGKLDYIQGPAVLQITKMKNIAAPKDNEESQAVPRMMKFILTDGQSSCTAVETEALKNLGFNTAPGSKILIDGAVEVECNILLLNNKNTRSIGGRVEKLAENWELKKSLKNQTRSNIRSEGGPPAYVPFGQKITSQLPNPRKENFKSLDANKEKSADENNEFQQQRKATIDKALQAKDSKAKTFGGGGKIALEDNDIAKIVDMGFSPEDAMNALRFNNGILTDSIHSLLNKGSYSKGRNRQEKEQDRGGEKTDRRERPSNNRPRRGAKDNDNDENTAGTQPSGPSTLFDFLTTKIPVKEESKSASSSSNHKSSNSSYQDQSRSSYQDQSRSSYQDQPRASYQDQPRSSYQDQSRSSYQDQSRAQSNTGQSASNYDNRSSSNRTHKPNSQFDTNNRTSDFHDNKPHSSSDSHNFNNRRQNVPPRFAQKFGKDGMEGSHFSSSNNYSSENDNYERTKQKRQENYQNDYNGSSRDYQSKYSQDAKTSDNYNNSQRSRVSSSQIDKKGSDTSRPQSNDSKYDKDAEIKSTDVQSQNNRTTTSKWEKKPATNLAGWNKGDFCLAKYWEDKQFYPAIIEAIAPNGSTCIVTFPDYGNQEEVFCTDMMPMPKQNWNEGAQQMNVVPFSAPQQPFYANQMPVCPPYQPDQFTMEFRRGGTGPHYNRKQVDKSRATQQYYQPPSNKSYQ